MMSSLLKHNKWLLACLWWLLGLMIIFSAFVTDPDDRHGLLLYNILFTLIFPALFLLITGRLRRWGLVAFFLLALPPSLIEVGWFCMDKSILIRNQFWVIFATNPAEASGLLSMVQPWQWLLLFVYLDICIALLVLALKESANNDIALCACSGRKRLAISLVGAFMVGIYCLFPGVRNNVPCVDFYSSYHGYRGEVRKAENFMHNRQDLSGAVQNNLPDSTATIVVVIGESLNRTHCSLYGYCRPTTPRLDARNDVIAYRNVVSPDFMTQTVLQQVLTFANDENPDARWNCPTLPELLNAAGWHTYWFDPYEGNNNTSKTIPTGFSSIAKLCTTYHLCDETEQYDGNYLNHLQTILADTLTARKAIFFHLIGNHFPYERRYPEQFGFFEDSDVCSPYRDRLSAQQMETINAYDNAVRYNDWLVDSIFSVLCMQNGCCAMIYFPDHGEEVYDLDFYAGRSFNHITRSLYEIPLLFWQNEEYSWSNPLYIDVEAPYCTGDMIHSLLDIFAVSYTMQDSTRSLFRSTFQPRPRPTDDK